jgi:hypothetical protein
MNSLIKHTDTALCLASLTLPQQTAIFTKKIKGGGGNKSSSVPLTLPTCPKIVHYENRARIS